MDASGRGTGGRARVLVGVLAVLALGAACAPIDVAYLADDARGGRDNATPGSVAAQNYLIGRLDQYADGLDDSAEGRDAFRQVFDGGLGTNILAVIPGTDLADEYVVVGAHYDHVTNCRVVDPGDTVCNGATDNAAGAAAVIDIARRVANAPEPPRRSLVLALWDREEDGLRGSEHYVANPLVPISDTVAYVNFDILGANITPSLRDVSFVVAAETGGAALQSMVATASAGSPLQVHSLSATFGQGRSDYVSFVDAGVPAAFFSDSEGPCYHTTGDEVDVVDFAKLMDQIRVGHRLTAALLDADAAPTFTPGTPLATYADAVALGDASERVTADLDRFTPSQQAEIVALQGSLAAIVAAGEAAFDADAVTTLLLGTLELVGIFTSTACDGFIPSGG